MKLKMPMRTKSVILVYWLIPVPFFIFYAPDLFHGAIPVAIALLQIWAVHRFFYTRDLLSKLKQSTDNVRALKVDEKEKLLDILVLRKLFWKKNHLDLGISLSSFLFIDGICLGTALGRTPKPSAVFYTFICVQASQIIVALIIDCVTYTEKLLIPAETISAIDPILYNNPPPEARRSYKKLTLVLTFIIAILWLILQLVESRNS
jgi:hypothetical protein